MTRGMRALTVVALSLLGAHASAQAPSLGTLRGLVIDSLTGMPLAGASVQIAPTSDATHVHTAVADAQGRFRFDSLSPGRWYAGFYHEAAEALPADELVHVVDVGRGETSDITLGLPGPKRVRAMLCPARGGDSTAALFGVVRDADTGRTLDSSTVSLIWRELSFGMQGATLVQRSVPVPVQTGGTYVLCGVPSDADLWIRGDAPGRASGDVEVTVEPGGAARLDVTLGADAARAADGAAPYRRGAARLQGLVIDDYGHPVRDARIVVTGADGRTTTNSSGAFELGALPSGTWTVEARAIGYEPARVTAALSRQAEASARIVLRHHVATLDRVLVKGRASAASRVLADFDERRVRGVGTFLSPETIAQRNAVRATELLQGVPGLRVQAKRRSMDNVVRGRMGCVPAVYLDGVPVQRGADDLDALLLPNEVLAIEVYHGPEAPARFTSRNNDGCGSVVIWTKR